MTAKKKMPLLIGIKRKLFRINDKDAERANQVFKAVRKKTLVEQSHSCYFCGITSKSNEVHHLDDNHHNNQPDNLKVVCRLCHPYHHLGEAARPVALEAEQDGRISAKAVALIQVPKEIEHLLKPEDLHHLMRAIGMALNDPDEAQNAMKIYNLLITPTQLKSFAQAVYGEDTTITAIHPSDIAAGMNHLTDDEYQRRGDAIREVRVMYHPSYLKQVGQQIQAEQTALKAPRDWRVSLEGRIEKIKEGLFS